MLPHNGFNQRRRLLEQIQRMVSVWPILEMGYADDKVVPLSHIDKSLIKESLKLMATFLNHGGSSD